MLPIIGGNTTGKHRFIMIDENIRSSGCIHYYDDDKRSMFISELNVTDEFRRKGVGTLLIQTLEQMCRYYHASNVYLWVKKDTWAHEWYKRLGYEYLKDHEIEENVIWMVKSLNEE